MASSSCHFARVFARVIDRHATLIGGWNERHDHETRTRRRRRRGEKVETLLDSDGRRRRRGPAGDGWDGHAVANLKGRPAGYVVR